MKRQTTRRAANAFWTKRDQAGKAERITRGRMSARTRRVRARTVMARTRSILVAFAVQIKKGSPRAIAVLGVLAALLIGVPVAVAAGINGHAKPALVTPEATPVPETVVMDLGTQSLSAGMQGASAEETSISITPTPLPSPTPEPDPTNTIFMEGMHAPVVAEIQARLMELGYMDQDEPTELYGPITKASVKLFQRKHNLTIDGCVGLETYSLLMSDQATKYSVSIGVEGTDVKELQLRLRELGYLDKATEYFGTETEAAVKKFQERNGLVVDGTIGEKTREMLYSEDAKANFFERGEVSEKLKSYQTKLKSLGYLTTDVDGTYGEDTEAAVKRFQERNGLIGDGYLGPQTIELLMSSDAQANALMMGMKGSDVQNVQQRLKELNYLKTVDGYFGSGTENAVRAFQERNGLSVDGKVGKNTMSVLMSSKAKKASSSGGSTSSGSSGSSGGSSSSGSGSGSSNSGSSGSGSGTIKGGVSVETFLSIAKSKLGSKYVRGGKGPNTFDCSGFVYWCLNQAGVSQSYMTSSSWQKTTKYQRISKMSDLQAGDVISYKGHVGIYLGGGKMIDASSSAGQVRITDSDIRSSSYWTSHFVCGYRIF
jgi:peptidoglycan hydrolase-like protein with peptidoglycan-binding domain